MSRKITEPDADRPHYYSMYWINIARQFSGKPAGSIPLADLYDDEDDLDEDDLDLPPPPRAEVKVAPPELDIIPGGRPAAPAKAPSKAKPPEPRSLNSLQDLAALGFGNDVETEDLAITADDEEEDIISRLASDFDEEVEPDEEEAASLETLEDEEWEEDEEEEDDGLGGPRRRSVPPRPVPPRPAKPVRKPPPRRRPDF